MLSKVIKSQLAEFDKRFCHTTDGIEFCTNPSPDALRSFLTLSMQLAAEKAVGAVEEGVPENGGQVISGGIGALWNAGCYDGYKMAHHSALQAGKKFLEG